jgi:phage-related protein
MKAIFGRVVPSDVGGRRFEEAVYVLHSFPKKTRKTSRNDVEIAKARYRTVVADRKGSE